MLANGTPVIAKKILGDRYSYPLDGNLRFADGRPLFGRSKTIRGVVLAVLVTTAGAPLIGLELGNRAAGRQLRDGRRSVFELCKRRLDLPSSSRASGLDQIPESLLPLLACRSLLALTAADIVVCVSDVLYRRGGALAAALRWSPARPALLSSADARRTAGDAA